MKLHIFSFLASAAYVAAAKKGSQCAHGQSYCEPKTCPSGPDYATCENDATCTNYGGVWKCPQMSMTKLATPWVGLCGCNCCKYTDLETGRVVDAQSCVQKKINHISEYNEICSCGCNFDGAPPGPPGCEGPVGPKGADGCDGGPGDDGLDGHHGKPGYAGDHGRDGGDKPNCYDGAGGDTGIRGVKGQDGKEGPCGDDGLDGGPGNRGLTGPAGPHGPEGLSGRGGGQGPTGWAGIVGRRGNRGRPGMPGTKGVPGPKGAQGNDGPPGMRGSIGLRGKTGAKGISGLNGQPGPQGARGVTGQEGDMGAAGANGRDSHMRGYAGAPGDNGLQGYAGADAQWEWGIIEAMIANTLYAKLQEPSEYCADDIHEMCDCGEHIDAPPTSPPVVVTPEVHSVPTPEKPIRDIIFLIDGSDSVSVRDWPKYRGWVVDFITSLNTAENRDKYSMTSATVVVQYSSDGHDGDNNSGYIVKKRLLGELQKLENDINGMVQLAAGTDTFLALEFIVSELIPNRIDVDRKMPDQGRMIRHIRELIVITSGLSRDFSSDKRKLGNSQLFSMLDEMFQHRFVIGIGSEITADDSHVQDIASEHTNEGTYWAIESAAQLDSQLRRQIFSWLAGDGHHQVIRRVSGQSSYSSGTLTSDQLKNQYNRH